MTSPFVFMDLRTTDLDRSRRFYSELFGWVVSEVPAGPATVPMFTAADGPWGGLTELGDSDQRQPQWIPYAPVADLGAAVERAEQLGAAVVRQRVDLPQGSVAVITDPGGATVALWEPARLPSPRSRARRPRLATGAGPACGRFRSSRPQL